MFDDFDDGDEVGVVLEGEGEYFGGGFEVDVVIGFGLIPLHEEES